MAVLDDFFTFDELRALSGYQQPKRIIRWLDDCQIPYRLARAGLPRVHRQAMADAMATKISSIQVNKNNNLLPNLNKVR